MPQELWHRAARLGRQRRPRSGVIGLDWQPKSGRRKITSDLLLYFANFTWTGQLPPLNDLAVCTLPPHLSSSTPLAIDYPGRPVRPWPAATPGEPFQMPSGRGIARTASDATTGRCAHCGRAFRRRIDGLLTAHDAGGRRCTGSGQPPAEDAALATWSPVLPDLTPHGLRHGHQTWMEEAAVSDLLRAERMGHEVPGMRGIYGHVTPVMRTDLKAALQERWEASLRERARLSARSIVPVLDALLAAQPEPSHKIGSHSAPRIGHQRTRRFAERNSNEF